MDVFLHSNSLFATSTALAGILLFGFAPRLPSMFPASFVRLTGFCAVCASLAPIWVQADFHWLPPTALGSVCLAIMGVIHVVQSRHQPAAAPGITNDRDANGGDTLQADETQADA